MLKEEYEKVVKVGFERGAKLQAARDKVRQATLELYETDSVFVSDIKHRLQKMIFAKNIVTFLGAPSKRQIDARLVEFYLNVNHRIYVLQENVSFDFDDKRLCYIKLTDDVVAKVPLKNATGIKSLIPYQD
ncbi:MAG: hypothetical protein PHO63_05595 [Bacilli bacterium]|nr:hypothetical protein [Bacilli bacterium]MDD4809237.1 hypothetical protein [Bacilli bacterium]